MTRRIPTTLLLPFGYDVRVVTGETGDAWGLWDDVERIIILDQTLKRPAQRRWVFEHEFEHAIIDRRKWVVKHIGTENPDGPVDEPAESEDA